MKERARLRLKELCPFGGGAVGVSIPEMDIRWLLV